MDKGNYLDSWKDIAAYLGRNVRTCRNWEKDLGLPIHRLDGAAKSHVFAYTGEIDSWRENKGRLPGNGENGIGASGAPDKRAAWRKAALIAGPVLAMIATALVTWHLRPAPKKEVVRSTVKVAPGHWLDGCLVDYLLAIPTRTAMAVSRDGRFIIYCAVEEGFGPEARSRLFYRQLDRSEATVIAGTEGGLNPFLSPDDRWVGFWTDAGTLNKVPVEGGVPSILIEVREPEYGADWGRDGEIVFSTGWGGGLSRVSSEGGKPEALTSPKAPGEISHRLPRFLPDGKSVIFTIMKEPWDMHPKVALLDLASRTYRVLVEDAADARYVPTGHLLFLRHGTLMAVPFDLAGLETSGQPVPVVSGVMHAINRSNVLFQSCAGQLAVSDSGLLAYVASDMVPDMRDSLLWVDHEGNEEPVTSFSVTYNGPRYSPDGRMLVFCSISGDWPIYVYDLARGTATKLPGEGKRGNGIWTPDGRRLVFGWWTSGLPNLGWQVADGSAPAERLASSEYVQWPGSITPDGTTLAYVEERPDTSSDIYLMKFSDRTPYPFLNSPAAERYPMFSPDGRWLAYASNESGQMEVYVRPFPNPNGKWKISRELGAEPLWSRDGKRLYYRSGDQVWMVDVRTENGFRPSPPRLLFEKKGFLWSYPIRSWDISPDGRRFLMAKLDQFKAGPVTEMAIVGNWFEELKRLVPSGKR